MALAPLVISAESPGPTAYCDRDRCVALRQRCQHALMVFKRACVVLDWLCDRVLAGCSLGTEVGALLSVVPSRSSRTRRTLKNVAARPSFRMDRYPGRSPG